MTHDEMIGAQLEELRSAILTLAAAGADGFEGLVRIALSSLTGIPFRLAASGFQGGMDGDSAFKTDAICFEAKRYSGAISRNEVLTKIVDLARNKQAPDRLWVLGATISISSQLALAAQEAGDQYGISTLVLDWIEDTLPLLAVAVVASGDSAIDFLVSHCESKPEREKLAQTFRDISKHSDFDSLLSKLRSNLNVSTLATARAIEMNKKWRAVSFGSENTARERFGQALSVSLQPALPSLRSDLRTEIKGGLQAGQSIVLTGGEGHGKSWLAAQICCGHDGLTLFASAEQFKDVAPQNLDEFLIDFLIKQTGDVANEAIRLRWRHRFVAWQTSPPASSLLIVVDGINQRQGLRWDRILNGLHERLRVIGGHLLVTVRPQFWRKAVAPGLTFTPKLLEVPEWTPDERNQLLGQFAISLDWLDAATLQTLCNPRLLRVAVTTLPHRDSSAWKGLTTDRILMEHLRASQRENFEDEELIKLTKRISNHAKEVLDRVRTSSDGPPQNFEADSNAVIETRFFRSLPGPGDTYELRGEGLTLALAYALVDQLWQAQQSGLNLGERMEHLVDPIYAMDRTVDVMFSALMVCGLDTVRFDESIFAVLLEAFSNLQNINDERFEEFVEIVKHQPTEVFNALGVWTLERGRRINYDWFFHAAFEIAATGKGWVVAEAAIRRWLYCYNKDAIEQTNRFPKNNDVEDAKRLQRTQQKIEDILASLSAFESHVLGQMTEVAGDTDSLFSLALKLLAGHSLVNFADSFIALGLGFSLDQGVWSARKAFQQLTTFNRVDREIVREAFLKAVEPLRCVETSLAGRWTIVRMLFATGDDVATLEAVEMAEKLREAEEIVRWGKPAPDEWRQSRVADPTAMRPVDMAAGLSKFCSIQVDGVMQAMGRSSEDHDLELLLPAVCRFEHEVGTQKARQILSGLLTRTGLPLRQLIFNGTEYSPLMTRDVAVQLIGRVANTGMVETLPEGEQDILRMCLFSYAAPYLTPEEQLACMLAPAFGTDYLHEIIPSLKAQPACAIYHALQTALDLGDEEGAYGALVAARYGGTSITSEMEILVLRCASAESSKLRALSFEVAIQNELKVCREAHTRSEWSAHTRNERTYENRFGSLLLIEAGARQELSIDRLLKRISSEVWFIAAERIGDPISRPLATHFQHRLERAVGAVKNLAPPAIDITLSTVDRARNLPSLSVDETKRENGRFQREESFEDAIRKDSDFDEQQSRLRAISDAFFEELKNSDARLLVERATVDNLRLLVRAEPLLLSRILETLDLLGNIGLTWLKNLVLAIANIVSKDEPERAVALFEKALMTQGFVTYALGDDLTLDHEAIWSSAPSDEIKSLWRQRLLMSGDDEILAREVLAAERFGASDFIKAFVSELITSASTLDHAYAVSIAGFSIQPGWLGGLIENHLNDSGPSGEAARKAKAAYGAAEWANKWAGDLWTAESPEEFWRCLIISETSMDARVSAMPTVDTKWLHYVPLFKKVRKAAIKERNKNRKKTFLGQEVPDIVFVRGY